MRGVTTIVVVILLLLVGVALASVAYIFLSSTQEKALSELGQEQERRTQQFGSEIKILDIDKYSGQVTVQNTGRYELSAVKLFIDGALVNARLPSTLAAGAVSTIMPLVPVSLGDHSVKVTAIPSTVSESSFTKAYFINEDFSQLKGWEVDYTSNPGTTVSSVNGELKLYAAQHTYAHVQKGNKYDNITLQAKIKISDGNAGASWAPVIAMYWNPTTWVGAGLRATQQFVTHYAVGTDAELSYGSISFGTYYYVKLILNGTHISYYSSANGLQWTYLREMARPAQMIGAPSYLVVGKGHGSTSAVCYPSTAPCTNPTLNNDYNFYGSFSYSYADDALAWVP